MESHNSAENYALILYGIGSCLFWGDKGCILVEFLPEQKTINAPHYHQTLLNLCHAL
jgi:Transposase.